MSCPNLCHDCQTVAHCEKSGCVPKINGPAPQLLQPLTAQRSGGSGEVVGRPEYLRGYADGLSSAALYVTDHCQHGEEHADVILALKRPNSAEPSNEESAGTAALAVALNAAWLMDNARDKLREVLKPFNDRLFDPYIPHMAEQAMSIKREQLRRALSWMGVSIGDSSDEGFAADISTHVNRLSDAVEAMRQMRSGRASDVPQVPAHIMMAISQYGDARADNNNDELAKTLPALIIYIRSALALAERNGEERAPLSEEKRAALRAAFHEQERQAGFYRVLRRGQHWSVIDGKGDVLRGEELDAAIAKRLGLVFTEEGAAG